MLKHIDVYTDGSCLGNPGPGGYGAVMVYGTHRKEISAGFTLTTNNRMELMGAIAALEALKEPCAVVLHSDSKYVLQGISEWMPGWKRKGWKTAGGGAVKNQDLWQRLDAAAAQHRMTWTWVKGHAGHVDNERVDVLARTQAERYRSGATA